MTERDFFEKIADLFGRKNWVDFSGKEQCVLSVIYEDIRLDGYDEGWDAGYNSGVNDTRKYDYEEY